MINIATSADGRFFFNNLGPWLRSTEKIARSANPAMVLFHVVCLDFEPGPLYKKRYPWINFVPYSAAACETINSNSCIQHGEWLQAFDGIKVKDYEGKWASVGVFGEGMLSGTWVFTDGDGVFQRPLTGEEVCYLTDFPDKKIGMYWNAGGDDDLRKEASRLNPVLPVSDIIDRTFCPGEAVPKCFNAGFIVARPGAWHELLAGCRASWPYVSEFFEHPSWNQWLINFVASGGNGKDLEIEVLPKLLHQHDHFGIPSGFRTLLPGLVVDADTGDRVFFSHKFDWPYIGNREA